jgi:hypothetical protein
VPRNQGPWVGYLRRVPNLLRILVPQLSGKDASMSLWELIVKDSANRQSLWHAAGGKASILTIVDVTRCQSKFVKHFSTSSLFRFT